ncbi:hypothetical protein GO986_11980 [Deinococcus sp. HMF7620]|uniref:Uncharacterized protein n=1 Tax=Deinococcus arboris TaxID=2682977 RepID=A0A7C9M976_9DEIO|nr:MULTISPECIES: hypothetical protein [Deinococcus]MBZ9752165.1 hypothetical protein [Deinococcus betulae]MVN87483.1 hypothetical protein [Deinococcus arboris]
MNTTCPLHPHLAPHPAGRVEDLDRLRVCPPERGDHPGPARDPREPLL